MSEADARSFLDTNVLVYAHDRSSGDKHERAKQLVQHLWASGGGCLSIQVLQEFYVVITQKVPRPLSAAAASEVIADLASWDVHGPTPADLLDAIRLQGRQKLSFWDALILTSAQAQGCTVVWSEDLNAGQRYGPLRVENPFA